MTSFTESVVEDAVLGWLRSLGYAVLHGPDIAAGMLGAERNDPNYRNERLADLMRRFHICEEKSSGIDRVVEAAEIYQLPAPDFRAGHRRTVATIYGPKPFEEMDRNDRVRACYQHCALRWVMSERMTNQSLRERFHLGEDKAAIASQIISATIEVGLIKADESVGASRKFARYLPFWA